MKLAVIETGGKQYKVVAGTKLKIEKLEVLEGAVLNIDKVLLIADDGKVTIGEPYIPGAVVETKVLRQDRAKKLIVFKYHSKTRYRRKNGHRQCFTEVLVTEIK